MTTNGRERGENILIPDFCRGKRLCILLPRISVVSLHLIISTYPQSPILPLRLVTKGRSVQEGRRSWSKRDW